MADGAGAIDTMEVGRSRAPKRDLRFVAEAQAPIVIVQGWEFSPAAVSVSLVGTRRLSDADVERARLVHQYALHRSSADAPRPANLNYARAALVEAQDERALTINRHRTPTLL
jgi:hypothetical protein